MNRQGLYDFKIIQDTKLGKDRAVIIQANPKPGSHGGVLFPSHYTILETYLFESGPALVRSKTEVTQGDYKFFKVETETTIRQ
ncbi:MAG: hypothetical protein ACXVJK_01980 [Candidatus Aminicenantales bacterium]